MLLSPSSVSDAGVGHQHLQPLPPQMQLICNTQQTVTEDGWMRARRKLEACSIESATRALLHFVELSIHQLEFYAAAAAAALRFLQFSQRTKHDLLGTGRA